ncbi:MAG: NADH-quinone oxidoreductase subunit N [Candidatus Tectomicrobia bacterium]|nr:NADH-quinone oxidoreductase subunit N [Candidatus Tectomicrobia bacterium]
MELTLPIPNLRAIMPELVMTFWACLVLVVDVLISKERKTWVGYLALVGTLVTMAFTLPLLGTRTSTFSNMFLVDGVALFFKFIFLLATALVILVSLRYLDIEGVNLGEYYAMILFATLGMMIMAAGNELITIYLSLELMVISTYVLCGFIRRDRRSTEAAVKYFLLGIFTSAILLYGMALLYGLTGTTNLTEIGRALQAKNLGANPALLLAMIFLAAGLGFKVAAVPFHMYVPDVYEGSPTPIAAFISVGPKAAGFAVLARLFLVSLPAIRPQWGTLLWVLCVMTMTLGNLVAMKQSNIKRMLAYSSIAHAGYVLIGLVVANEIGLASVVLYMFVYAFMNIGAFSMVILMCKRGDRGERIEDFRGLARSHPWAAIAFLVFFLSLAGIPPTGGFIGKFYLFSAAIQANYVWLAVIGVANSALSVYYYFRVTMLMYMSDPSGEIRLTLSPSLVFALAVMVIGTLAIGLYPSPLIAAARASMAPIFGP